MRAVQVWERGRQNSVARKRLCFGRMGVVLVWAANPNPVRGLKGGTAWTEFIQVF